MSSPTESKKSKKNKAKAKAKDKANDKAEAKAKRVETCRFFQSEGGCRNGDDCRFAHEKPQSAL